MNKTATKALAMIFLGGGSLLLGLVPMKLKKWFKRVNDTSKYENIFSSLLCFGGGLLLATSLLNILPEVIDFEPFQQQNKLFSVFTLMYFKLAHLHRYATI